jgi:MFS family permease
MTISEASRPTTTVHTEPAALAEPTAKVSGRWITLWSLANFAMTGLVYGAGGILAPEIAERIDPANKVSLMAMAAVLAGFVPLIVSPLFGALTDRTTSRRGRRHPWILASAVGAGVVFAIQAWQSTVGGLLLISAAGGLMVAVLSTSLVAVIPDEVPVRQRATVSAWGGAVGGSLGVLICTGIVVAVNGITAGYLTMAALIVVGIVPFALFTRGVRLRPEDRPAFRWRRLFSSLWVSPKAAPDFWWALSGRFLFFLANALFSSYLFYFLKDRLHQDDPAAGVLVLTTVYVLFAALVSVPFGRISDKRLRRKKITIVSATLQALACLTVAVSLTWTGAIIGAVLLGLGFGVYMSVDQALVTEVLPQAARRGKDLGLINMTFLLATLLAPAIAAPVILNLGGYATLFGLAAVVGVGSAVLVQPIKSVR